MSDITFSVDGHDEIIEALLITGLRRNSENSTTVVLRDDTTIHINEPFDSVYERIQTHVGDN